MNKKMNKKMYEEAKRHIELFAQSELNNEEIGLVLIFLTRSFFETLACGGNPKGDESQKAPVC